MSDLLKLNNIVQRNGDKGISAVKQYEKPRHGRPMGVTNAMTASVERLWGNDAIRILYIVGRDE